MGGVLAIIVAGVADGGEEGFGGTGLVEKGGGAGLFHSESHFVFIEHGQAYDTNVGHIGLDETGGFDAVHLRHGDVHENDLGFDLVSYL